MECLQYITRLYGVDSSYSIVLNLVINGMPSIPTELSALYLAIGVLNLVINGMPSILWSYVLLPTYTTLQVLNLVINGMPSIRQMTSHYVS